MNNKKHLILLDIGMFICLSALVVLIWNVSIELFEYIDYDYFHEWHLLIGSVLSIPLVFLARSFVNLMPKNVVIKFLLDTYIIYFIAFYPLIVGINAYFHSLRYRGGWLTTKISITLPVGQNGFQIDFGLEHFFTAVIFIVIGYKVYKYFMQIATNKIGG